MVEAKPRPPFLKVKSSNYGFLLLQCFPRLHSALRIKPHSLSWSTRGAQSPDTFLNSLAAHAIPVLASFLSLRTFAQKPLAHLSLLVPQESVQTPLLH